MIKELIQKLAEDGSEKYSLVCKVIKVEGMNCEVEPINGDSPILDVRLVADESANKYVLIPKVGSYVVVAFLTKEAAYVSMVSEVSEVLWKVGNNSFSTNENGLLITNGADSLKDAIVLLIEAVEEIIVLQGRNPDRQKLINAKTKVNKIFR
ncbi:MAG: hypothetical protein Q8K66_13100 [Sediminibacterium sp.]|nr:hypothetical protein [Sediminibacterium sp.]MDP3128828.1 hypothetical protein [Sediminibacterium sp.]